MIEIYVSCLASRNAGKSHGEWIDALQDADEIQSDIAAMLRNSPCPNTMVECPECEGGELMETCEECNFTGKVPSAEEWVIDTTEGFEGAKIGEHPDLEMVSELAKAIDEYGEAFARWWENEGTDVDVKRFEECYRGEYKDVAAYAEQLCEDIYGLKDLPTLIRNNIDWEKIGDELERGDIWTAEGGKGVYVFENR